VIVKRKISHGIPVERGGRGSSKTVGKKKKYATKGGQVVDPGKKKKAVRIS